MNHEEDPPNPLDEIQKQLSELFKGSNVKVSAPGMAIHLTYTNGSIKRYIQGELALQAVRRFHLKPKEIRTISTFCRVRTKQRKSLRRYLRPLQSGSTTTRRKTGMAVNKSCILLMVLPG